MQRAVAVWICFLLALSISCAYVTQRYSGGSYVDAGAFWCGTRAVLERQSPYTNEPLNACESAPAVRVTQNFHGATLPAPLPPYAFAALAPFGLLPFGPYVAAWTLLLILAALACVVGIHRCTGLPLVIASAVVPIGLFAPAIPFGSLAPIPIALLVWAAVFLQRQRWGAAALALGLSMIEPTIALPACLAALIFVPAMRWRIVVAGLCAAALSVAAVGVAGIAYYFGTELPAHALSEAGTSVQYGLNTVLFHLGVPGGVALRAASAQYALGIVLALFVARALAVRTKDAAVYVLVPAGFAVMGGTFVHLTEVAMLIPLASWVAVRYPSPISWGALVLLALPLDELASWALLAVPAGCVISLLLAQTSWVRRQASWIALLSVAGGSLAVIASVLWLRFSSIGAIRPVPVAFHVASLAGTVSSSIPWAQWMSQYSSVSALWWTERGYTFAAMAAVALVAIGHAVRRPSFSPALEATPPLPG